jgi:hypothetical protein
MRLVSFWFLSALACGREGPVKDTGAADTGVASCGESDAEGYVGVEAAVYCQLVAVIMDSEHDEHTRHAVLECLPDLSTDDRTMLLNHWQEATPDAVYDEIWALAQSECETTKISELR